MLESKKKKAHLPEITELIGKVLNRSWTEQLRDIQTRKRCWGLEGVSPRPPQMGQLDLPSGTQERLSICGNETKQNDLNLTESAQLPAVCSEMWVEEGREIRNPAQPYEWT